MYVCVQEVSKACVCVRIDMWEEKEIDREEYKKIEPIPKRMYSKETQLAFCFNLLSRFKVIEFGTMSFEMFLTKLCFYFYFFCFASA